MVPDVACRHIRTGGERTVGVDGPSAKITFGCLRCTHRIAIWCQHTNCSRLLTNKGGTFILHLVHMEVINYLAEIWFMGLKHTECAKMCFYSPYLFDLS